jgi:probable regulatory domain-containing protein
MVIKLTEVREDRDELESIVARVFFKGLDLLGGLNNLAEYRALTWLASLARASFVVVLKEEYMKTDEEIAEIVGMAKNSIRNILRADVQAAMYKIQRIDELTAKEKSDLKVHTAGGLAKLAYKFVKEGKEAHMLSEYWIRAGVKIAQICNIPWVQKILNGIKGIRFPIEGPDVIIEKLKNISINNISIEEAVSKLSYPVNSPEELLCKVKQYVEAGDDTDFISSL